MREYSTIAAVDLGSNSFRLQVARVVGDQIYPLDSLKEPVRLGAGLTQDKLLDEDAQQRAITCLKLFSERLRDLPRAAVRVVGTNTFRVAKNGEAFLEAAQAALGFPIEVIAGKEEARLIYIGVSHGMPSSDERRLVVDIGEARPNSSSVPATSRNAWKVCTWVASVIAAASFPMEKLPKPPCNRPN